MKYIRIDNLTIKYNPSDRTEDGEFINLHSSFIRDGEEWVEVASGQLRRDQIIFEWED